MELLRALPGLHGDRGGSRRDRDLAASAGGPTHINLDWSAPDANGAAVSGYKIEVSPDGSSDWSELVANTGTTAISYSHTGLAPGTTRHYRVSAINSVGTGPASNVDNATTPFPMLSVSFGAATYTATEGGTDASVTVSLSGMPLREVEIEVTATNQGTTTDGDYSGVPVTLTFGASETSKTFTVTAAVDTDDDGDDSVQLGFGTPLPTGVSLGSQATATVGLADNDALGAPTGLTATATSSTQIDLTWSAPASDGGAAVSGYRIEVSTDTKATWTDLEANTSSTGTAYSHSGLTAGVYRHYRVSAINSEGTGPASAAAGATTPVDFGADSELAPSGLSAGDTFRLLFLSSETRDATSTDIADYNSFVQTRAAAGHADIQTHSGLFRAVGCTSAIDARDNTVTTGTGVPIYWLNGPIAAAGYGEFYGRGVGQRNQRRRPRRDRHEQRQHHFHSFQTLHRLP